MAVLLLSLLACSTSWSLGHGVPLTDLLQTHWTARDGAPTVTSLLAQTSDGYLWMGDSTGLSRFDALRFEHVEIDGTTELTSAPVHALFAPREGGLWIGYSFGGIAFLHDGHATVYGARDGLPASAEVTDFAQQPDGTLWIATSLGLGWMRDGHWHRVTEDWNLPAGSTIGLTADSTGAVWTQVHDRLYRLAAGQHRFEAVALLGQAHAYVVESPTGEVWAADHRVLQQVYQNPASHRSWGSATSPALVDGDGAFWGFIDAPGAHGKGGYALARIARQDLPPRGASLSMSQASDRLTIIADRPAPVWGLLLQDHEGNVWLTGSSGPVRFSERNLRQVTVPAAKARWDVAAFVADEDGSVWLSAGIEDHVYRVGQDGQAVQQAMGGAWCMAAAPSGDLWIATEDALWRTRAGHTENVLPLGVRVQSMAGERTGALWISIIDKGLFRLENGRLTSGGGLPALDVGAPLILSDDGAGRLWAGYADGRVAVVSGATVRFFGRDDGLSVGSVVALYGRRQSLWVGGEAGLARSDGHSFQALLTDQPGLLRNITGIVETASGDVWLNTATGIVRLPLAELKRAAADKTYRMSVEVFGTSAGLEGTGARIAPLPTLIESKDGRIWAMTSLGIYAIDPSRLSRSPLPPATSIQGFVVDDRAEPTKGVVALPPRSSALHFHYAGLSLTAPEQVQYRYRLDGLDKDWHAVQDQRDAYYMNLAPGSYRFRVQSRIAGMDWNAAEAALAFTIAPAFVQTRGFLELCVLVAVLAIWLVVRARLSQMARRIRIGLIARIGERERIARELNDTLLQGTQGLLLSVHALAARAHRGEQVGDALDRVVEGTDEVILKSRDRIQDLCATTITASALPESIQALGTELQRGSHARLQVIVRGAVRQLDPTVADEVFCISREALRNAFKHANATVIRAEITYDVAGLKILVLDDGIGIDVRVLEAGARPGHWGLAGMRERAVRISARFAIRRRDDAGIGAEVGTEVELIVAASTAYATLPTPLGWLARLRSLVRRNGAGTEAEAGVESQGPSDARRGAIRRSSMDDSGTP